MFHQFTSLHDHSAKKFPVWPYDSHAKHTKHDFVCPCINWPAEQHQLGVWHYDLQQNSYSEQDAPTVLVLQLLELSFMKSAAFRGVPLLVTTSSTRGRLPNSVDPRLGTLSTETMIRSDIDTILKYCIYMLSGMNNKRRHCWACERDWHSLIEIQNL